MFTGIIEALGKIQTISQAGSNKTFFIESSLAPELGIDESVCHNGACLTVEDIQSNTHKVTAIQETLEKTNLGNWKPGDLINLERSMKLNGRLDGHIVQGHVDCAAKCLSRKDMGGSYEFTFEFDKEFAGLIIEKGSICLNGISLTVFNLGLNTFSVAIIPYTYEHTNFNKLKEGEIANVEFDILGKYVERIIRIKGMK